jgi:short-subunit dehydrogenase involved in D-alanine esterification of teichoic acids
MESKRNKIALVTGGSRGLGKEMALNLAKKGLDVILTYNSKKEEAEAVVKEIENLGQKAAIIQLNVAESTGFDSFFQNVTTALKSTFDTDKFDFLVNNAGVGVHESFLTTTEAQVDNMVSDTGFKDREITISELNGVKQRALMDEELRLKYVERIIKDKAAADLGLDNVYKQIEEAKMLNPDFVYTPKYKEQ